VSSWTNLSNRDLRVSTILWFDLSAIESRMIPVQVMMRGWPTEKPIGALSMRPSGRVLGKGMFGRLA
jgi:hypothetical protein